MFRNAVLLLLSCTIWYKSWCDLWTFFNHIFLSCCCSIPHFKVWRRNIVWTLKMTWKFWRWVCSVQLGSLCLKFAHYCITYWLNYLFKRKCWWDKSISLICKWQQFIFNKNHLEFILLHFLKPIFLKSLSFLNHIISFLLN